MALPLTGVRIVDLTRALSGPFCAMTLADLGADVVKIEPTPSGDMVRTWGPFDRDISAYYLSTNRNKRGVAVNFRDPRGLALIRRMIGSADVVLENFKTGVMEEMGLGYATLSASNPRLVYGSITGFGSGGPMGNTPGFDQIAQGYSGLMSVTGQSGPTRVGVAIGDLTSGMWTAMGVLAALLARHQTGRGQRVETSLLASLIGLLSVQGQRYLSVGEVPEPTGNLHPVIAPYGVFETADGPLNIAPATPDMWVKLCRLLELDALLNEPRFIDNQARMRYRDELRVLLESRLKHRTRAQWTEAMTALGIPCGPINDLADVFADPQVVFSKLVEEVQHPVLGALRQVGLPIRMSESLQSSVRLPPPMLGEHTERVLSEYGFDPTEIRELKTASVIMQYEAADPHPD